ncbi:methyl-accepting chemotaxis protein [Silvimonas soli]|uniref:methyl-accepting chemotaxis protein n=1 Tax=Silvimonas soli TaxID=2980100 RepID=UPI0024B3C29D|nr:methyl-accepting chemotaxis protein [Silvimonas soli]
MSIGKRLLLLIGFFIAGLVFILAVGIWQLGKMDDRVVQLNKDVVPSILAIKNASENYQRMRVSLFRHLVVKTAEEKTSLAQKIAGQDQQIKEELESYKSLISDDQDKTLLDADIAAYNAYLVLQKNMLDASSGSTPEQGIALMMSSYNDQLKVTDAFAAHAKYNNDLGNKARDAAQATYSSALYLLIGLGVLVLVGAVIFSVLIYRSVTTPLAAMRNGIEAVESRLDFRNRVNGSGRDEVGVTIRAFNKLQDKVQNSLKQLRGASTSVAGSATQLSDASEQVAKAAAAQSEATASMAASIEEMTVSITHVSDRAGEAQHLADESGKLVKTGRTIIGRTADEINRIADGVGVAAERLTQLEQQTQQISSVVRVIRDVADQTNLLALNAAIEAARAGETGRGFAVVADEVRKLAERTAQSTAEISKIIESVGESAQRTVAGMNEAVELVHSGVAQAGEARTVIEQIGEHAGRTVDMVSDISAALREQSQASSNIAQQVERIAQMTDENSAIAGNTSEAARNLGRLAEEMEKETAQYQL